MKKNYHRFHEILFIDNQIKHKMQQTESKLAAPATAKELQAQQQPEDIQLVLLSGINNEGKNVLFGFALCR
jgi:hypothetical protein